MANTPKILGQSAPAATTEATVYTVPASTNTVISTVYACNRGATATTFRIAVRPTGIGSTSNQHYIYYDLPLPPKDTFAATVGITLEDGDHIVVFAGSADVTFQLYGNEVA